MSALVLMILCASGMAEDSLRLSARTIKRVTEHTNYPKTGWTAFYERCGFKYGEIVFAPGSTAKFEKNSKRQDAAETVSKDVRAEQIKRVFNNEL